MSNPWVDKLHNMGEMAGMIKEVQGGGLYDDSALHSLLAIDVTLMARLPTPVEQAHIEGMYGHLLAALQLVWEGINEKIDVYTPDLEPNENNQYTPAEVQKMVSLITALRGGGLLPISAVRSIENFRQRVAKGDKLSNSELAEIQRIGGLFLTILEHLRDIFEVRVENYLR